MGRLLKKKDPGKKKTKQSDTSDSGAVPVKSNIADAQRRPPAFLKKSVPAAKAAAKRDPNFIQKSIQFLREVKIELMKVTWPSRKQTMGSTAVVIVLVMIVSLFLGLVDFSLSNLIRVVLQ
ncbi:MAG: preprotein translocase subunit SecE [Desulfobacteraceae bacterium]|nr:preprotein translocase subunit SecE [Desulfobacteraceae bacterium]